MHLSVRLQVVSSHLAPHTLLCLTPKIRSPNFEQSRRFAGRINSRQQRQTEQRRFHKPPEGDLVVEHLLHPYESRCQHNPKTNKRKEGVLSAHFSAHLCSSIYLNIGIVAFAYGKMPMRASRGKSRSATDSASSRLANGVNNSCRTKSGLIVVTNNTRSREASREI